MTSEADFYSNEVSGVPSLQSPPDPLATVMSATHMPAAGESVPHGATEPKNKKRRTGPTELLIVSIIALLAAIVTQRYVVQVYAISGHSMMPTLNDREMVMIHKLSPGLFDIDRGDIVIFNSPTQPGKDLIKRVIALPGDHLEIEGDHVWVNGELVEEPYALHDLDKGEEDMMVPAGKIFVLGDNRPASSDSRNFSAIPIESVHGEVFLRFWPLRSMGSLP